MIKKNEPDQVWTFGMLGGGTRPRNWKERRALVKIKEEAGPLCYPLTQNMIVLGGSGRLTHLNGSFKMKKGDHFYIPRDTSYELDPLDNYLRLECYFGRDWPDEREQFPQ